uniref:CAAX prenyl protease 2/Lysostaphin resistance protein A-like domain-containing protein n=1 Tax=Zea mays TaxID=4577 RepID=A0A804RKI2_MAIZE
MELGKPLSAHRCSYTATYTHCSIGFSPRVVRTSWIRAAAEGGDGGADRRRRGASFAADGPRVVEVAAAPVATSGGAAGAAGSAGFGARDAELAMWDKLGAVVRLSYGIGIYGAMALAGRFICQMAGIDCTGGFHPSLTALVEGLGYAAPPIMALLFILDDEVVKYSPHARAIRDVEDEELRSFFCGMSPWQFILIVAASSIGEELFYRAAIQGALADIFLRSTELMKDARGIASLSGIVPPLVPFAQTFAAVITAALTGTLYYVATTPKGDPDVLLTTTVLIRVTMLISFVFFLISRLQLDPTYVVTPAMRSRTGRENLKKLFAAWYERRQMRKIYSPLLEGILAFYLGFEWIQTDNILAPMITHGIYSTVVLGHGLWKIHDHRRRLRQRIQKVRSEGSSSADDTL